MRSYGECGMDLAQSETPCTWRRPLCGTWEASCRPQPRRAVPGQSGKLEAERSPAGRYEESDDCIVPRKPRTKPSDIGGGDGGGKAVGRRKGTLLRMSRTQSRNWHVTEAARPRIGAGAAQAPMADHVRPSTGARCVSSARRDLCGGERGNLPPTATVNGYGAGRSVVCIGLSDTCRDGVAAAGSVGRCRTSLRGGNRGGIRLGGAAVRSMGI